MRPEDGVWETLGSAHSPRHSLCENLKLFADLGGC